MPEAPVTTPEVQTPPPPQPAAATSRREPTILPTLFGEGYDIYETKPGAFIGSYAFIITAIVLFLVVSKWFVRNVVIPENSTQVIELTLPMEPSKIIGGPSGGGASDPKPASKGVLPQSAKMQITPPRVDPKPAQLEVAPTLVGPPTPPPPQMAQLGDPLGKIGGPLSNGPGSGGGIGSGSGGGVGSGNGVYRVGGGVTAPVPIFQPDPEYSEEARKAKYQGVVVLTITVGTDGRPRDVRVARSLGLGLDEKAIESVKTWKFEPGRNKDGIPVAVQVNVEVDFHLY